MRAMKKIFPKILIALAGFILLVLGIVIGSSLYRKETASDNYGDLKSLHYYTGGGFAGLIENYEITQEGDKFILSVRVEGLIVSGEINAAAMDDLRDIIAEQDLFRRNGDSKRDENLADGYGESLTAEFEKTTLTFSYYGTSHRRNEALCKYLYHLAEELDPS